MRKPGNFQVLTHRRSTYTNSIKRHKNKRKKPGVTIKLLITQNGMVKPTLVAVSASNNCKGKKNKPKPNRTLKQKMDLVSKIPITVYVS